MKKILKAILLGLFILGGTTGVALAVESFTDVQSFYKAALTSSISSSATTINVSTAPYVNTGFLVIEPRTPNQEIVFMTSRSGTSLTVIRGLSATSSSPVDAGYKRAHAAGSSVEMVDVHYYIKQLQTSKSFQYRGATTTSANLSGITGTSTNDLAYVTDEERFYRVTGGTWVKQGDNSETIGGVKTFTLSPIVPTPTTGTQVVNKDYADNLSFAGAPNASTTSKGIVQEATSAEIIANTDVGSTGARLFINPTHVAKSGPNKLIMTDPDGKLDPSLTAPYFISLMDFDSGTRMINSNFLDSLDTRVARSGTNLFVDSPLAFGLQVRGVTSDWASAVSINGSVTIGAYTYVLLRDSSDNYRVYRYSLSDLSLGGTLMTISGQAFSTTGGSSVQMTSDGTNFWFSYKGGNSANGYILSKYTFSGTTLTYVSDVSCGSTTANLSVFSVLSNGTIYGISSADGTLRKYNSSGTLQATSNRGFAKREGLNNYVDTLYIETDVSGGWGIQKINI